MATIALYAEKINQMPGLIKDVKQTVTDYKAELSALKSKTLTINKSVCDLDDVISAIQGSSQTQEKKIASLDALSQSIETFITEVVRIDGEVAEIIRKRKDEFYNKYYYLKPECEKDWLEQAGDWLVAAGEWCIENWESIGKIILAVVIIVALGIATALTGGILGVILAGAFWGALSGALIGGVMGGITSAIGGGSFLDGFADGALTGAITGAITGAACAGLSVAGAALGKGIQCLSTLGKVINVTSKVTRVISLGMDGFDLLAMGIGFFDPDNQLVKLNQELHSSALYNGFQIGVNALAIFTAGATSTMACFIAGTMILTAAGLVAIENIKAGDKVTSTNTDTFETAEKTVLETYIRKVPRLVHLTINGELITTTVDHPFYVKDRGFVNAGELCVGDAVINSSGETYSIDSVHLEIVKDPVKVYNFQVEDFHTYHVGNTGVLVHNASYDEKVAQLNQNVKQGKAYEDQEFAKLNDRTSDAVEQITIKTEEGTRFRIDAIGLDNDGAVIPAEFKSSQSAPLTKNQSAGFPQLESGGGTVVGKGKGIFSNGYEIPKGTKVEIIRPQT